MQVDHQLLKGRQKLRNNHKGLRAQCYTKYHLNNHSDETLHTQLCLLIAKQLKLVRLL